jgi:hypothetical protein
MSGGHLSKEFFEVVKSIGESRSKQEEDKIIVAEVRTLKVRFRPAVSQDPILARLSLPRRARRANSQSLCRIICVATSPQATADATTLAQTRTRRKPPLSRTYTYSLITDQPNAPI